MGKGKRYDFTPERTLKASDELTEAEAEANEPNTMVVSATHPEPPRPTDPVDEVVVLRYWLAQALCLLCSKGLIPEGIYTDACLGAMLTIALSLDAQEELEILNET